MRRALLAGCILFVGFTGCPNPATNFGPFPGTAIVGNLTAGVAGFVPNTVPGPGEFQLTIVNTDSTTGYVVNVTPQGDATITRNVATCSAGNVAVSCQAASILIELAVTGAATPPSLTITPDATNCLARVVYISVTAGTSGGNTVSLTETIPASAATCLGGSTTTGTGGLGMGGFGGG